MLGTSADPDNSGRARQHPKTDGRSAVMYGAFGGEHIARVSGRSNGQERTGARTPRGSFRPLSQFAAAVGWSQAEADRYSRVRPPAIRRRVEKHEGGERVKARSRPTRANPGGANPRGVSCFGHAKPVSEGQGLPKG
jgi:hypothetical protein